jgi:RNA-splicing ligase RtcB
MEAPANFAWRNRRVIMRFARKAVAEVSSRTTCGWIRIFKILIE